MPARSDLEDFEAFLEPEFEAAAFANGLLLATNDPDTGELDLLTPAKRLVFDLEECDKRMAAIANTHYETMIANLDDIEATKELVETQLNPLVERITASFERVQKNVIQPYDNALKMNNAMKRIHSTLTLLRGSGYFVFLLQQLQELEKTESCDTLKLARLYDQISHFYSEERDSRDKNAILSLRLVREYEPLHTNKRSQLLSDLVQLVTGELGHHVSFSASNSALLTSLKALYVLSPLEFFTVIDKLSLNKQVQTALTQLTRSLQSPRNFISVVKETQEASDAYLKVLGDILGACEVNEKSLLKVLLEFHEGENLTGVYWSRLSFKFKKNIASTMARGGPIAKNLKVYHPGIKSAIMENFGKQEADLLVDALEIIVQANR